VAIVVGSHGALSASELLLARLSRDFPAAVVFDLHRSVKPSHLGRALARRTELPLVEPKSGLALERGTVYLAPADRSLLVSDVGFLGVAGADVGRPWHRFVDVLLSTAAQAFGARLVVVVLSGYLDAGVVGIRAVKTHGGRVLAQDPSTALAQSMPRRALDTRCVDFALPPESLGDALVALCAAPGAAELFRVGHDARGASAAAVAVA
jgi:two-component system chemotaxis response regulator CheB